MCHPVKRLISRYYHASAIGGARVSELGADFEEYQDNLINFAKNATSYFDPIFKETSNNEEAMQKILEILVSLPLNRILNLPHLA